MEYYCKKCGEVCIRKCGMVICVKCGHEVEKDKADKDNLLDACKAFQNRWKHSGPSGSAQWEKFDKVVNGIDAAIALAKKEG